MEAATVYWGYENQKHTFESGGLRQALDEKFADKANQMPVCGKRIQMRFCPSYCRSLKGILRLASFNQILTLFEPDPRRAASKALKPCHSGIALLTVGLTWPTTAGGGVEGGTSFARARRLKTFFPEPPRKLWLCRAAVALEMRFRKCPECP